MNWPKINYYFILKSFPWLSPLIRKRKIICCGWNRKGTPAWLPPALYAVPTCESTQSVYVWHSLKLSLLLPVPYPSHSHHTQCFKDRQPRMVHSDKDQQQIETTLIWPWKQTHHFCGKSSSNMTYKSTHKKYLVLYVLFLIQIFLSDYFIVLGNIIKLSLVHQ